MKQCGSYECLCTQSFGCGKTEDRSAFWVMCIKPWTLQVQQPHRVIITLWLLKSHFHSPGGWCVCLLSRLNSSTDYSNALSLQSLPAETHRHKLLQLENVHRLHCQSPSLLDGFAEIAWEVLGWFSTACDGGWPGFWGSASAQFTSFRLGLYHLLWSGFTAVQDQSPSSPGQNAQEKYKQIILHAEKWCWSLQVDRKGWEKQKSRKDNFLQIAWE